MYKYILFKSIGRILLVSYTASVISGCNNSSSKNSEVATMVDDSVVIKEEVRESLWKLNQHRILFAHHSIGRNIIDGMSDIAKDVGVKFHVASIQDKSAKKEDRFLEFHHGKNKQPKTKVDAFVNKLRVLDSKITPDLAVMKFCYVDFLKDTDVDETFEYYKKNILMLKEIMPDIKFIHFTIPLMSRSNDIKTKFQRLIGKDHWIDVTNVKREKYNELLLKTFSHNSIFDIAKIESTRIDGSREEFVYKGKIYHSMVPIYTNDGGHLNKLGRRIVAKEFILFLANTL